MKTLDCKDIVKDDLKNIMLSNIDWDRFKNSSVLITGAYGMLAQYMVFTLMYVNECIPDLQIKVIALCRNEDKAKRVFSSFLNNPLFKIVVGDVVGDIEYHPELRNTKIDYIVHSASAANAKAFFTDPVGVISANIIGTQKLLDLAVAKKTKRFLFFSSGESYGVVDKKMIGENDFGFLDPTQVRSCYGESKRMGENLCVCYFYQHQVPTIIVRPEHTYGPSMDLENDCRVFAEFVSDIVNNRDIIMKGDGTATRTFTYIADATIGFFKALLDGKPGEAYNVSNNSGTLSIKGLADLLVSLFPDKNLKVVCKERGTCFPFHLLIQPISDNYVENKHKIQPMLSDEKMARELGVKCNTSVKDGFYRTVQSFIE